MEIESLHLKDAKICINELTATITLFEPHRMIVLQDIDDPAYTSMSIITNEQTIWDIEAEFEMTSFDPKNVRDLLNIL